jgi:hypothetical protein
MEDDVAGWGLRIHQRPVLLATSWLQPPEPGFGVWLDHEGLQALLSLLLLQQCPLGRKCDITARRPVTLNSLKWETETQFFVCVLRQGLAM